MDVYPTKDGQPVTDLTKDDFEVFEDKAPQKVDQFEHILIRPAGPQETRHEPNTVAESREALNDPRARAFVVFLDTYHVEVGGSHNIRQPLVDALNRTIGQDDLVAVMTPEMSARDLTFARRTETIEGMLTRYWPWGERERINSIDPIEDQYRACFPGTIRASANCASDAGIAQEMIDRRRERLTLNALRDLVRYLRDVREERTAIITISDGWLQFRPDATLARAVGCQVPSGPDVAVDPVTGRLTTRPTSSPTGTSPNDCERDRLELANIDDAEKFRQILDEANRANASFYPIDPRGLAVFDTPIVSSDSTGAKAAPMTTPSADRGLLRVAPRFPSNPRRGDRRPGRPRQQRSLGWSPAGDIRPDVVLPARVLLERQAGREVPFDHRAGEAAGCAGAGAAGVSGADAGGSRTRGAAARQRRRR